MNLALLMQCKGVEWFSVCSNAGKHFLNGQIFTNASTHVVKSSVEGLGTISKALPYYVGGNGCFTVKTYEIFSAQTTP